MKVIGKLSVAAWLLGVALAIAPMVVPAAENLRLNPHLDYSSDSRDGPLISGDRMEEGAAPDIPNYIIFFGEG